MHGDCSVRYVAVHEGLSVHNEEMVTSVFGLCTKGVGEGGLKAPTTGTSGTMTRMIY